MRAMTSSLLSSHPDVLGVMIKCLSGLREQTGADAGQRRGRRETLHTDHRVGGVVIQVCHICEAPQFSPPAGTIAPSSAVLLCCYRGQKHIDTAVIV